MEALVKTTPRLRVAWRVSLKGCKLRTAVMALHLLPEFRKPEGRGVENTYPKWNPGTWKQGPKPAVPIGLHVVHTQFGCPQKRGRHSRAHFSQSSFLAEWNYVTPSGPKRPQLNSMKNDRTDLGGWLIPLEWGEGDMQSWPIYSTIVKFTHKW